MPCPPSNPLPPAAAYQRAEKAGSARAHTRSVLVTATRARRERRIRQCEGIHYSDEWFRRWSEAEALYFQHIVPAHAFDLVLRCADCYEGK